MYWPLLQLLTFLGRILPRIISDYGKNLTPSLAIMEKHQVWLKIQGLIREGCFQKNLSQTQPLWSQSEKLSPRLADKGLKWSKTGVFCPFSYIYSHIYIYIYKVYIYMYIFQTYPKCLMLPLNDMAMCILQGKIDKWVSFVEKFYCHKEWY